MRWGSSGLSRAPIVLGNAMPKSGSHLIIQVLEGLTELGPFVNPGLPPVNRFEDNSPLPEKAIVENIQRMRTGDIGYGYLHAREPFLSTLTESGRATIFVFRDPRDVIISHIFYATDIHKGHGMHHYYTKQLRTMEERINAAIEGVTEPRSELDSIRGKYDSYLGWMNQSEVLCIPFEALIQQRDVAIGKILDYLEKFGFTPKILRHQAITLLEKSIAPQKSGTFRKGQPGNWREYFTQGNIEHFKMLTGDLLIQLGYETSKNW